MMKHERTESGGRIAQGETPLGTYYIECDVDNNIIGTPRMTTGATKPQGLGDTVKKITDAAGIPQCPKCPKRQATLNKWFPYNQSGESGTA